MDIASAAPQKFVAWPAAEKLLTLGDSALVPEVAAEDSRTDAEERPFAVTVLVLTPDTLSVPDWPEATWLCEEEEERVGACLRGVATREGWLCVEDEELRVAEPDRVTGVEVRFTVEDELLRVAELLRVCDEEEGAAEEDEPVLLVAELLLV